MIVHWEIRERMTGRDIETIVQRGLENFAEARPRIIISDNGPQCIARDFKGFIRISGMTHVRTSPHYPQSNGKLESTTAKRGDARTARSSAIACGRRRRCRSTRPAIRSHGASRIKTRRGCIRRSAPSRRLPSWPGRSRPS
jgi:hypothetical protein